MKDYFFTTKEPLATNSDAMDYFLNSDEHFYSCFDKGAEITLEDGTYAEVVNGDGLKYAVHAGGNGDFCNHKIRFTLLNTTTL